VRGYAVALASPGSARVPRSHRGIRADLAAIFGEARSRNCTVVTFTMPDLSPINPFGRRLRGRMLHFNHIIREEAERYGVLVMDFLQYPLIPDPRLFSQDRLHGSELGHERLAGALAWRLGIDGTDKSWADPFPEAIAKRARRPGDPTQAAQEQLNSTGGGTRGTLVNMTR
jgi:GDSL-like Lipase/Acylhydrolase family